ncbi:hypothetical protein [Sodalis-like endosymbiont of Proechinophthirus fluctus]|uniref:hypothetical protein n=1 Tax=Sodalis-like endosymbiont of Proechinophthirus fluctus TaxID=1462730 RepID=UPI000ABBA997|nr:hypothetical protein [Sodalis-like endosymbiont of Proechinophthirus fluctus]
MGTDSSDSDLAAAHQGATSALRRRSLLIVVMMLLLLLFVLQVSILVSGFVYNSAPLVAWEL